MSTKKVRVRFAPSPTGYLHIGNLRTVLFAYLTAKSQGGDFILRIEDTDQKRFVEGATEKLIQILDWVGIKFDEGETFGGLLGPYTQSLRKDIYQKYAQELLEQKKVYRCFCSAERLEQMRAKAQADKLPPRYDRACRDLSDEEVKKKLSAGEPFVIRQKMPLSGEVTVRDELRGDITFKCSELEDQVLIKTNGIPTYQFAVVVDDHLMEITHVTRSDEWIPSFPKNILLYRDFGWEPPLFIHFPVVLNKTGGGKLSKRQGDVNVEQFRGRGYLPEALINFCVLLGWHPAGDNEIFSLEQAVKEFDYRRINPSPAVFDDEKLDFFNNHYIKQKSDQDLLELLRLHLAANLSLASDERKRGDDFLLKIVQVEKERLRKLSDIGPNTEYLFLDELEYDRQMLFWKNQTQEECLANLREMKGLLPRIDNANEWTISGLEAIVLEYIKSKNGKPGDYLWPLRVSLCGRKQSPSPFELLYILGRDESNKRIESALGRLV